MDTLEALRYYGDPCSLGDTPTKKHMRAGADEITKLRADLAAAQAELVAYKRSTDLAYKGSELETQTQLLQTQADNARLREAVQANHEWHKLYDIYEGYIESDLASTNSLALATNSPDDALREYGAKLVERICGSNEVIGWPYNILLHLAKLADRIRKGTFK